jgi:hypothetical protein
LSAAVHYLQMSANQKYHWTQFAYGRRLHKEKDIVMNLMKLIHYVKFTAEYNFSEV